MKFIFDKNNKLSLAKKDRIKSKKIMESLFKEGKSLKKYPLKLIYISIEEENEALKFAVTVPKRLFKNAVDRNELKRKIREVYRKNNNILKQKLHHQNLKFALMFIYVSNIKEEYSKIEKELIFLLNEFEKRIGAYEINNSQM